MHILSHPLYILCIQVDTLVYKRGSNKTINPTHISLSYTSLSLLSEKQRWINHQSSAFYSYFSPSSSLLFHVRMLKEKLVSYTFILFMFDKLLTMIDGWMCVEDESEFSYEQNVENGPEKWGKLKPEWKMCGKGEMQSPIDLMNERVRIVSHLGRLTRNYKPCNVSLKNRGHDMMVILHIYISFIFFRTESD